ncbi:acyl-CoA dehydrogenase family protein [Nocardia yamanashiensis]|uniref:acyl-CoA dehydrogenase family protein n=1 Tax=Nocardia yamanashiensis TaxID=209247 RepID=UPI001E3E0F13|nr:acyl-CoA dehydrogenase family protein [Nocardia yamanashiensis]UGT41577.1 acyl-CoA dehydrogenase family protein [Nocardia yamanashiensis]
MSGLFPQYRARWETEEHSALRAHAAEFFAKEVTPHQERWAEQHQVDREFWNKMGDAGLLCLDVAEEFGGGGGNFGHEAVIAEELAFARDTALGGWAVHSTIAAHYIQAYGTDEQKRRWLPGAASGDLVLAIAMTEPGTGSDLQAVKTTAVREGDEYVINGSKTFISNGTHCDAVIIVAKTDPARGAQGVSLIVAETAGLQGFSRGRVLKKIGQHGQDTRELFFDNMRVPAANVLGGAEGQGFYQLMNQLTRERLILSVYAVAGAETAVLEAVAYTKQREAFGRPIIGFQNTKFVLADCKADVLAGKTLVDYCVEEAIAGTLDLPSLAIAKLWTSEKQFEITSKCLQLFGGYGYMMEYPIAQAFVAARAQTIYAGTSEIMRELIGRSL